MSDYDEQTKEELQDRLRDRDLPVSGTKDELVQRLQEDDAVPGGADRDDAGRSDSSDDRPSPRELAAGAARQLAELLGREVEGVVGLRRHDDRWRVVLEVVEVSRVPRSTDVVGAYEVELDRGGELVGYERVRRFVRGQAGEE